MVRKKGKFFLDIQERINILSNMKAVDEVITFDDSDGTAIGAIKEIMIKYPNDNIIFANGGDRSSNNIPEMKTYAFEERVAFKFGVGGSEKMNSSSKILAEWKSQKVYRDWGYYRVLHNDGLETKVKELVANPQSSLSLQRHHGRSEYWIVSNGEATVRIGETLDTIAEVVIKKHDEIRIPVTHFHQLMNKTDQELKIVEIQYGSFCTEDDIERFSSIL